MNRLLAVGIVLIVGCNRSEPWRVDPITLEGAAPARAVDPARPHLKERRFVLKVCFKSPTDFSPAWGAQWEWNGVAATSDHRGCFQIPQSMRYHEGAVERFLPLTLNGAGDLSPSTATVEVLLNPWSGEVLDPRYHTLPEGSVGEATEEVRLGLGAYDPLPPLQALQPQWHSNLGVSGFSAQMGPTRVNGDQTLAELRMQARVVLRQPGLDGTVHEHPTTDRLRFELELTDGSGTLGGAQGELNVLEGELLAPQTTLKLQRLPSPQSRLEWRLRLYPSALPLHPWEGASVLGTGRLEAPRGPWVESPVVATQSTPPAATVSDALPHGFYLDQWKIRSTRQLSLDPITQKARNGVDAEICLKHSVEGSPVVDQTFEVWLEDPTDPTAPIVRHATTDPAGCLRTPQGFEIPFSYFETERYLERRLVVQAVDGPYQGVKRSVAVAINPWQRDDGLLFWDLRRGPAPKPSEATPSLEITGLSYQYPPQGDDLELDPQLNLTHKEVFYLRAQPFLSRPTPFHTGRGPNQVRETLWPGTRLKVKVLFAATRLEDLPSEEPHQHLRLLSGYETTGTIDAKGELLVPVALAYDFKERPLLEATARVFVEIGPLENTALAPLTLEASFEVMKDEANMVLTVPLTTRWNDLLEVLLPKTLEKAPLSLAADKRQSLSLKPEHYDFWKPRERDAKAPLDLFLTRVGLPDDLVHHESGPWPTELEGVIAPSTLEAALIEPAPTFSVKAAQWMVPLCDYYFADLRDCRTLPNRQSTIQCHSPRENSPARAPSAREACRKDPGRYLRMDRFQMVEEILAQPRRLPVVESRIDVTASFFQDYAVGTTTHDGHSSSTNVDVGTTAKVGFEKFGNGVTAHASLLYKNSWFSSTDRSVSLADRQRLLVSEVRTLVAEESPLVFRARLKDCLFFRHRGWMARHEMTEAGRRGTGYLFCRRREAEVQESWFYVSDVPLTAHIPRRNRHDIRNRTWTMLLRGRGRFQELKSVLQNRTAAITMAAAPVFQRGVDHLAGDARGDLNHPFGLFRDGGVFPGMLGHQGQ